VAALSQTSGKGQRGNVWLSEAGQNLTFSIVLKFPAKGLKAEMEPMLAYDQFVLSEITSLAIVDLLADFGIEAKIKWPNDIYIGDRKICGMLIENSLRGEWIQHSIIGIGLNVNQRNFDVTLPNPTSMVLCNDISGETGSHNVSDFVPPYKLHELLEELVDIFRGYLDRYCHIRGGYGRLRHMYLSHLWRKDEPAVFFDNSSSSGFTGMIRGLSDVGHLLIETNEGELREFAFKEISYNA
jgi:BirA family biotin operon repressor/biotin-[acetyl-CoA-carboxylase] ligase